MKKFLYRMVLMILEDLLPELVKMILEEIRNKDLKVNTESRAHQIVSSVVNETLGEHFLELSAREQVLSSSDEAIKTLKENYHA